jgi:hypothetical protein
MFYKQMFHGGGKRGAWEIVHADFIRGASEL